MGIEVKDFGKTKDGKKVTKYILTNKNGMQAEFLDYGAVLQRLLVPDKYGNVEDVVLGYDDVAGYENTTSYLGAFIGRNSNRLGGGSIKINGKEYLLEKNDNGVNNLHSGFAGYNTMMYEAEIYMEEDEYRVEFSRVSPDGEQGFPGNVKLTVVYTLTDKNDLMIEYLATPDQDTIINLTNHSYFNLAGHDSGDILKHKVTIDADNFTPIDANMIPTGEIRSVEGTPMDFRTAKEIGQDIDADYEPLHLAGGYDHNYALKKNSKYFVELVAMVEEPTSGRVMKVYTDRPGMQFYTGNFLGDEKIGKDGMVYKKHAGFCLETQGYPDAPNKPDFPSTVVRAGEEFDSITVYRFF